MSMTLPLPATSARQRCTEQALVHERLHRIEGGRRALPGHGERSSTSSAASSVKPPAKAEHCAMADFSHASSRSQTNR